MSTEITRIENFNQITEQIIGCCFKVHTELGPGFNEKIYQRALKVILEEHNLRFETEKEYPIFLKTRKIGILKLDLVINDSVIIELKALTGVIPEIFKYQILSYLKASGLKVGLLVNFGNKSCQIKRFIS